MPEAYRYAFAITLSLSESMSDELCEVFVALCKKAKYYAIVFEKDDNGRLHAHAGVIYGNARTAGNVKSGTFLKNKEIRDAIGEEKTMAYALKVTPMVSDGWIANYMQKDGLIYEHNLPDTFEDIRTYFPDTAVVRTANPEFERWERMYLEENRPMPCEKEDAEAFFLHHTNVARDLKVVKRRVDMAERVHAFRMFINKEIEPEAAVKTRKRKREGLFAQWLKERLSEEDYFYATHLWLNEFPEDE